MAQGVECHVEVVEEDLVAEAVVAGAEVLEGAGVGDKIYPKKIINFKNSENNILVIFRMGRSRSRSRSREKKSRKESRRSRSRSRERKRSRDRKDRSRSRDRDRKDRDRNRDRRSRSRDRYENFFYFPRVFILTRFSPTIYGS